MKTTGKLASFIFTFLALTVSAYSQSPRKQVQQMVEQLQKIPNDSALRSRIVKLGAEITSAPATTKEAEKYEGRAKIAFENAESTDDSFGAAKENKKPVQSASGAAGAPSGCDHRGIALAITTSQIQKAYSMSIECESALLKEQSKPFAEPMLRFQYLATAQILTAQGKFDTARDRISKAETLARNFLIPFDEIEDTTKGYLLERSGRVDEAVLFYLPINQPYAKARLAIIYLDRKQATAATDAAGAALKDDPTNSTALVVLGSLMEKTNPSQALVQYKSAIASASAGNPSVTPLRYLELSRASAGIARLEPKP